ncbi:MAG: small multidrug resistance pump [Pseudonocardiales bacterium]|nr:small multidrug resistance pump [Pseudonocardiales bacterium]MDT7686287.1 small multidrug resistance pump [Pseudonocardiales bacterium]
MPAQVVVLGGSPGLAGVSRHEEGTADMVWVLLAGAILSEVMATISLRLSEGFSKAIPSTVVVVGYLLSFVLLAQVLKRGLSVGVAYGIWAAVGVSLVALIGAVFLGESLTWIQVGGLVLVIAGVVAVQSGASVA